MKSLIKNALGYDPDNVAPKQVAQAPQTTPTNEAAQVVSPDEEELRKLVEQLKVNIKIVGCGGGGSNTITRLYNEGVMGATLIAANTDAPHLLHVKANRKILLGKRLTRGLGAGADPRIGEEAAKEA
ncbi:MAG: cell division protein FtsZ, partial [Thermoplasmata archaeon]|nr:cell division protein FtsZ [Euryarchaeota archaeon]